VKKESALGGQDLRSLKGLASRFPTDDSKRFATKLLKGSQGTAEVGAIPSKASLTPPGPKLQNIAVRMPSPKGMLPKIGSAEGDDMSIEEAIRNDPLVQYLKKQAEAVAGMVSPRANASVKDCKDDLRGLFANEPTRPKWVEKDVEKLPDWK
jgi:hypothetical protein